MELEELNDDTFVHYAVRNYYNPRCIDAEEFFDDLNRFKYIKRLVNRYNRGGDLAEKLVLNHLTIIMNVFGHDAGLRMLEFKIGMQDWSVIKPFLVFTNSLKVGQYTETLMDQDVVKKLRQI